MSFTNQQPWAGVAGAPDGIVMVQTANFMTLLNGSPQGTLAGQSGSASVPPDMVWDWYGKALYICTQSSGTAAGTVWTEIEFVGPFTGTDIYANTFNASVAIADQGSLTVGTTASIGGNTAVGGTLTVAGTATLHATTVNGTLTAQSGGVLGGTFTGSPTFNFPLTIAQSLRLPNNIFLQSANAAGTYYNILGTDASNNTYLRDGGGGTTGIQNQAGSAWLLYATNAGAVTIPGTLAVAGAVSTGPLSSSTINGTNIAGSGTGYFGSTLQVAGGFYPSGNIYNIGGIANFYLYNSSGRSVVQFASNEYILWDGSNFTCQSTGAWFFGNVQCTTFHNSGNSQVDGTLGVNGVLTARSNVTASGVVQGSNLVGITDCWVNAGSTGIGLWGVGSGTRHMTMSWPWSWDYTEASGAIQWTNAALGNVPGFTAGPGGNCGCYGSFVNGSDVRWKSEIITDDRGLEIVRRLRPRSFLRKGWEQRELGFVAQEVQDVLPEAVFAIGEEGMIGIADQPILAALVNAVRELEAQIAELRK